MGFSGTVLLARTPVELTTLPLLSALSDGLIGKEVAENGWRFVRFDSVGWELGEEITQLAELAEGPVLWAHIVDSDYSQVRIARPGADPFDFWLHPDDAEDYGETVDPAQQAAAAAAVTSWAGPGADPDEVTRAISGNLVFAEDSVSRLAAAVGARPIAQID
jgi:hypothetical protein